MRNINTSRSSTREPPLASSTSSSTTTTSSSARMPYDRSSPMATSASRQQPQLPTLARRTQVTPKLSAASINTTSSRPAPTSAPQRQTVTLAAPALRRSARQPEPIHSRATIASSAGPNATRRESPTPNRDDHGWDSRSGLEADHMRQNGSPAVGRDSKFFYASDAPKPDRLPGQTRSQPQTPVVPAAPPAATVQQKSSMFFYANGDNLPSRSGPNATASAPYSPTLAAPSQDPLASKFMYANGTPDLKPSLMTSGSSSVVSTSSRAASGRSGHPSQPPALAPPRAPSPPKPPTSQPHVPTQSAAGPTIAERRSIVASAPHLGQNAASLRRISSEAPPRRSSGHSRSGSSAADPAPPSSSSPMASPLGFSNPALSMASVLQAAEELAADHDDNESTVSGLTSPKSASGNDPLTELVASARRERKVQDLQITNASLEAINRTLERQLRKQTNELRRFKRLSRAGRLPSASSTTAAPSRAVSDSTTSDAPEGPLNSLGLSDLSEEGSGPDADDKDLDSEELSESDSTGSAQTSPSTMAARDVRHRKRDEKRLQVDLSKHQQLLIDSQKMNQSLKRCLGWTEELIREGQRALAYQVRVSEVEVGGHGAPDDGEKPFIYDGAALWDHDDYQNRGDELDQDEDETDEDAHDDADETMRLRIERLRPVGEADGKQAAQDRDSGIVLPGESP